MSPPIRTDLPPKQSVGEVQTSEVQTANAPSEAKKKAVRPAPLMTPDAPSAKSTAPKSPLRAPGLTVPVVESSDGSRVIAQLGDLRISEKNLASMSNTVARHRDVLAVYQRTNQHLRLGVKLAADGDIGDYIERIRDAVALRDDGAWNKLHDDVARVLKDSRAAAHRELKDKISNVVLRKRLRQEKLPEPEAVSPKQQAFQNYQMKVAIISKMITDALPGTNVDPDSETFGLSEDAFAPFKTAYQRWIDSAVNDALWAPHELQVAPQLAMFKDDGPEQLKAYLTQVYEPTFGVLAAAEAASQLKNGGDAHDLTIVLHHAGKAELTVADLLAARDAHPKVRPFIDRLLASFGDPLSAADTPIDLRVTAAGKLQAFAKERVANEALDAVRSGRAALQLVPNEAGVLVLTLGQADGVKLDKKQSQRAMDLIDDLVVSVAFRLDDVWAAKSKRYADAVPSFAQQVGLTPYLKRNDWLTQHPTLQTRLAELVTRDVLAGVSPQEIGARIDALHLPRELAQALHVRERKARVLALSGLLPKPPYELAQAQRLLVMSGLLDGTKVQYGVMDDTTKRALWASGFGDRDKPDDLALTEDRIRALTNICVSSALVGTATLGRLLLKHPAMREYKGGSDPLRFMAAYLIVSGRQVRYPPADAKFIEALQATAAEPLDPKRLASAAVLALTLPPVPSLDDAITVEFGSIAGNTAVVLGPAAKDAREATLRQWEMYALPMASREVGRSDLAAFPKNFSVAALRLAIAKINGRPRASLFNSKGELLEILTGDEIREWHDVYFKKAAPDPELQKAFLQLADEVDDGLVISTLNDLPNHPVANRALGALRGISKVLYVASVPGGNVELATGRMTSDLDLPSRTPMPLAASMRRFDLPPGPIDSRAIAALEKDVPRAAPSELKAAIASGSVVIRENELVAPNGVLRGQAEQLRALFIRTADARQQKRIEADSKSAMGALKATLVSAWHQVGTTPGYNDHAILNDVTDALVVGVRRDMARAGIKPLPQKMRTDKDQRRALFTIDADLLDYIAAHYTLDDKLLTDIQRGFDDQRMSASEVREKIKTYAKRMRSGEMEPWRSLNVDWGDTDDDIRMVKLLASLALTRKAQGTDSNLSVALHGLSHASGIGVKKPSLALPVKAWLVQLEVPLDAVGEMTDARFSPVALRVLAAQATTEPLRQAAQVVLKAAAAGKSITLKDPPETEEERALRALTAEAPQGSRGSIGTFDFTSMLARVPGERLIIRTPGENRVIGAPRSASAIAANFNRDMPWSEQMAVGVRAWQDRVDFALDLEHLERIGTTALLTYAQNPWMAIEIPQGLFVRFPVQGGPALWHWITADTEEEALKAKHEGIRAVKALANLGVAFTQWWTLAGATQMMWHEAHQGRIAEAIGISPILRWQMGNTVRMAHGLYDMVWTKPKNHFVLKGKPYHTVAVSSVWTENRTVERVGVTKRALGHAYSVARRGARLLTQPQRVFKWPAARVWNALPSRDVRVSTRSTGLHSQLSDADKARIAQNPEGRTRVRVVGEGKGATLLFKNSHLIELGMRLREDPGLAKLPDRIAKAIGATGFDKKLLARIAFDIAEQAPSVASGDGGHIPTPKELADNPEGKTTFRMVLEDGEERAITLQNKQVLRLLVRQGAGAEALRQTIRAYGLEHVERSVMATLSAYDNADMSTVTNQQWRTAGASDVTQIKREWRTRKAATLTLPEGVTGAQVVEHAQVFEHNGKWLMHARLPGSDMVFRIQPKGESFVVRTAEGNVSKSPAGTAIIKALEKREWQQKAQAAVEALEAEHKMLAADLDDLEKAPTAAKVSAKLQALDALDAKAAVLEKLGETGKNSFRTRMASTLVRARIEAAHMTLELSKLGFKGTVRIVEGVGQSIKGSLKGPGVYMVLVYEGTQLVRDVSDAARKGDVAGVFSAVGEHSAKFAGITYAMWRVAQTRLGGAVLSKTVPGLSALAIAEAPNAIMNAVDAVRGSVNQLDGLRAIEGFVPEVAYLKLDEDHPFFHKDNDVEALRNEGRQWSDSPDASRTSRQRFWLSDDEPSITARLDQTGGSYVKPDKVKIDKMKEFKEPTYRSYRILARLDAYRASGKHPWLPPFDFTAWVMQMRELAVDAISRVRLDDATETLVLDEKKLRAMMRSQDPSSLTHDERQLLRLREDAAVASVMGWMDKQSASRVPLHQQADELVKLLINTASVNRLTTIMHILHPTMPIDDVYTLAPFDK